MSPRTPRRATVVAAAIAALAGGAVAGRGRGTARAGAAGHRPGRSGTAGDRRAAAAGSRPAAGSDHAPGRSGRAAPAGSPRPGRAATGRPQVPGGTGRGTLRAWAELLRLPALFTVPGDALAGAAATGARAGRRTLLAIGSSVCLYEAGMALNDWADRAEDAVDRPHRPLPSGRVRPAAALAASGALTAAGLALAAAAGRPALTVATGLAATVWAYDLGLKHTPAGPAAMAAARALDLLLGAAATGGGIGPALPSATMLGSHTFAVTAVSRHEAQGGAAGAPSAALAATGVLARAVVGGRLAVRRDPAHPAPAAPSALPAGRRAAAAPGLPGPGAGALRGAGSTTRGRAASTTGSSSAADGGGRAPCAAPGTRRRGARRPAGASGAAPGPSGAAGPSRAAVGAPPGPAPGRAAPVLVGLRVRSPSDVLCALLCASYGATTAGPLLHAALNPSPELTQRAVGAGIRATIPLQAALIARAGNSRTALLTAALAPAARAFARKVSVT
ncbi:hypothetical protein GCM10018793_40800 [Streptomyces sulfonofaciens]|uniref:Prenyltransferase n=1 Tax=Streptomyces sulfonofaciens TaxID=68272 RepID=A0A919L3G3_9ACTN|nr:UbiA family prenyltransferase [Streptomyces sulfonofaciens]GHH82029.1 hypothetical protein GCM10018793_40800 [Streptomyces sulfonofaciens]